MKRLAEYKAKNSIAVSDTQKNPTRADIMKEKPLQCTPDNPDKALTPSLSDSIDSVNDRGDAKEGMERVFAHYLAGNPASAVTRKKPELEIRFQ